MATTSSDSENVCHYQKLIWIDTVPQVKQAVKELKRQNEIALDSEGDNLSREGTLDILIIGTMNKKVFLFDIFKLGRDAFQPGLGGLLESDSKTKLMYDCRNHSDALMHLYDVKLAGVLDLQLVEIDIRRRNKENHRFLKSLKQCIAAFSPDQAYEPLKERLSQMVKMAKTTGSTIWDRRPLDSELKDYCAIDSLKLFELLRSFKKKMNRDEMLKASERYVDYFRSYKEFPERKYYRHSRLPNDILSCIPRNAGVVYGKCHGCRKEFRQSFLDSESKVRCSGFCDTCSLIEKNIKG